MKQTILITDGAERAALAVVRSLGRQGYQCVVSSNDGRSLAGASKYARRDARVPDALGQPDNYRKAIVSLSAEIRADLVIPISEASVYALLPARAEIHGTIPFPAEETFRAASDKARVLEEAINVGIRVPEQWTIESPDHGTLAFHFPAVLKPTRSIYTRADGTRGKVGVRWVHDRAQLDLALAEYPVEAFPVMAQRVVSGPGIGVFVLMHQGHCFAQFSHRRLREKPPRGGVSVYCQSEVMHEPLLARTIALLQALAWSGVAMVEYKLDVATGEHVLMEINGRFWGSLQLAIDAGVDFPALLAAITFHERANPVERYKLVRTRWVLGDLDNLWAHWKDPKSGTVDRFAAVASWLAAFRPGIRNEVFRWTDPAPSIREAWQYCRAVARPTRQEVR